MFLLKRRNCFGRGKPAVKQAVVDDEYIFSALCSQWFHKVIDNSCGKQSRKTLPVGFRVIEEPINGIFAEIFYKNPCLSLHVHTPVRKDEAKEIPENVHHRDSFHFRAFSAYDRRHSYKNIVYKHLGFIVIKPSEFLWID